MRLRRLGMVMRLSLGGWAAAALAGPPLNVDDSETLKAGEVEIFVSGQYTRLRHHGRVWESPVELTVGWKHEVEFSLATGWTDLRDSANGQVARGVLALEPGVKWAFRPGADDRIFSGALGWKLHLPLGEAARRAGVGGFGIGMNFAATWNAGFATIDFNIGAAHFTASSGASARQEGFLGLALRKEFIRERLTGFLEFYATPEVRHLASATARVDLGLLWDVSPRLRWSVLAGRGIRHDGAEFFGSVGVLISLGAKAVTPAIGHTGRPTAVGRSWRQKLADR